MPDLEIKLCHRYVCRGKSIAYIGLGVIQGFRRPREPGNVSREPRELPKALRVSGIWGRAVRELTR